MRPFIHPKNFEECLNHHALILVDRVSDEAIEYAQRAMLINQCTRRAFKKILPSY